MTTFGQSLIVVAVLASGIIYGTDVFSAIVLRPALAQVDDHTLVSTMGRVHEIADRRMRVPGVAGIVFAIAGTALLAGAHHTGATIAGVIAIVALAIWLGVYARVSAPINARLTAAAKSGEVPSETRLLQQRWDGVINTRSALQMIAILAFCVVLISS